MLHHLVLFVDFGLSDLLINIIVDVLLLTELQCFKASSWSHLHRYLLQGYLFLGGGVTALAAPVLPLSPSRDLSGVTFHVAVPGGLAGVTFPTEVFNITAGVSGSILTGVLLTLLISAMFTKLLLEDGVVAVDFAGGVLWGCRGGYRGGD